MRNGKIASSAEYLMHEQFQNCQFLEPNFGFLNGKNSRNLLIIQFGIFQEFPIWKNPKTFSLLNSKNFRIPKIIKFPKLFYSEK